MPENPEIETEEFMTKIFAARHGWLIALLFMVSCSSNLTLTDVDFAWPVESVETVDQSGRVEVTRYAVDFPVTPLAIEESAGIGKASGKKAHVIRNSAGYYFVTVAGFRNVYVFSPGEHELKFYDAIPISETGLQDPAFNQRSPHIELIDGSSVKVLLMEDGIVERDAR